MEKKISIIIPVYNAEKFLKRCLESVINQTYKNLEIICVDDGSKDNSSKIIEKIAKKDNRIILIKQKNQGVSIARNNAIEKSTGEYIMFLDSDDYMDKNMCEIMIKAINEYRVDVVRCNYKRVYENGVKFNNKYDNLPIGIKLNKEIIVNEILPEFIKGNIKSYLWLLIIKAKIIKSKHIKFVPNIKMMQDKLFYVKLLQNIDSIYQIDDCCYNYFCNLNSTIQSKEKVFLRIEAILKVFDILKKDMIENNYYTENLYFEMQEATFFHIISQIETAMEFKYSSKVLIDKLNECKKDANYEKMLMTLNEKKYNINIWNKLLLSAVYKKKYNRLFLYLKFKLLIKKIRNGIMKNVRRKKIK